MWFPNHFILVLNFMPGELPEGYPFTCFVRNLYDLIFDLDLLRKFIGLEAWLNTPYKFE